MGELGHGHGKVVGLVGFRERGPAQTAHLLQHASGVGEKLLPLGGEGDALIAAVEQQIAKLVFQVVDHLPQVRLGDEQSLSGLVDGAQLGHLDKAFQMFETDVVLHGRFPSVPQIRSVGDIISFCWKEIHSLPGTQAPYRPKSRG